MYKIIEEMLLKGFSQRAIANKLEISRGLVSRYANIEMIESSAHIHKARRLVRYPSGFDVAKEFIENKLAINPKIKKIELYRQVMEHYPSITLTERTFYYYLDNFKSCRRIRRSSTSIFEPVKSRKTSNYETINKVKQAQPIMDENESNISSKIKKYREFNGLSKKELAEKIGVTSPMITYYEQGKRNPSLRTMMEIASVTMIPVEYYLTGKTISSEEITCYNVKDEINKRQLTGREGIKENDEKQVKEDVIKQVVDLTNRTQELMISDPDKCIELGEKALKIAQDNDYDIGTGMAYTQIASGYMHKSNYNKALKYSFLSEPIYRTNNDLRGLRETYNNIGAVYHYWGNHDKALEYFHKNLNIGIHYYDPLSTTTILNNIGVVYVKLNAYDKALKYFNDALVISEKHDFKYKCSHILNNLGNIYIALKKPEKAEDYLLKSISLGITINNYHIQSLGYRNLSELKIQAGCFNESLKLLERALDYAQRLEDENILAKIFLQFAHIHSMMKQPIEQLNYLNRCISITEPNNFREVALSAYKMLTQLYEGQTDYRSSLTYYKKMQEIKDFISDEKRTKAIEEIKVRMEVERTEREKAILQQKNAELHQMNEQVIRQKKRLEKAEKKLTELNRDLEIRVQEETEKRRRQELIIIQKSKLESLGQLAAGIAHEINQPLGIMHMSTQNMVNKIRDNNIKRDYLIEKSGFILENINRIKKIIEHVRLFSRDQKETQSRFNVVDTVDDALSMISTQCRSNNINIVRDIKGESFETLGSRYRLEQVLINLITNSKDALDSKYDNYDNNKRINLRVYTRESKICIEVEDNGCGIDEAMLHRIFEPFYTTKEERKGTGLGLSICYGIIKEMNGTIGLESKKDEFTRFKIELPNMDKPEPKSIQELEALET